MADELDKLVDCRSLTGSFDYTKLKGIKTIDDLLQQPFDKHIGSFEIPVSLKDLFDVDQVNAVISWYLDWKLKEPVETQNTCTVLNTFGHYDGTKAIIAINLYKYLRNQGYDPDVMEKFIGKQ